MLKCPHCGGSQFKAVIKRAGAIQLTEGGATILKELDKFSYEVVGCLNPACKKALTNADLVDDAPCAKCGTVHKSEDLVDGLCPICHAMKDRPELAQASTEDLIRMLLEAEKRNSTPKGDKIEEKLEKSDATVEKVAEKAEKAAATETPTPEQGNSQTEEEKASEGEELSPQQRAAQTRKANAEKKKAEEEAARVATIAMSMAQQAVAEKAVETPQEVVPEVAPVVVAEEIVTEAPQVAQQVAPQEVITEESPFEPDFGSMSELPEGDDFPMPAFTDNPF